MRTEEEIRKRIAELEETEQKLSRDGYAPQGFIDRESYSKSVLRAQIRGLLYSLGDNGVYLISGEKKVGEQ